MGKVAHARSGPNAFLIHQRCDDGVSGCGPITVEEATRRPLISSTVGKSFGPNRHQCRTNLCHGLRTYFCPSGRPIASTAALNASALTACLAGGSSAITLVNSACNEFSCSPAWSRANKSKHLRRSVECALAKPSTFQTISINPAKTAIKVPRFAHLLSTAKEAPIDIVPTATTINISHLCARA